MTTSTMIHVRVDAVIAPHYPVRSTVQRNSSTAALGKAILLFNL
jgi:hypothetical protein